MRTIDYNPSILEVEIASIIAEMETKIQEKMHSGKIIDVEKFLHLDNPRINFIVKDQDGDTHKVVVQVIQSMDSF